MGAVLQDNRASASPVIYSQEMDHTFSEIRALINARINASPKRLIEPGPSFQQLRELLNLAAAAPDHGLLMPWRFVLIPTEYRYLLGEVFFQSLIERDPFATIEQTELAKEKAFRSPVLLLAISCLVDAGTGTGTQVSECEQVVSLGAAVQNILLGAHSMGFGAGLTSGNAMSSKAMRDLFKLEKNEKAVCFINVGTVKEHKKSKRIRPTNSSFFSILNAK